MIMTMIKDDILNLCSESYLKGQEDILEMLIDATNKYYALTGRNSLSINEIIVIYKDWLKQVKERRENENK